MYVDGAGLHAWRSCNRHPVNILKKLASESVELAFHHEENRMLESLKGGDQGGDVVEESYSGIRLFVSCLFDMGVLAMKGTAH
jgi:hypothetical protein